MSSTQTKTKPKPPPDLSVELPWCPGCGNLGKQPMSGRTSYDCTGPAGAPHSRTRMLPVVLKIDKRATSKLA